MPRFSEWLINELRIRNWSQSDLARKSKLSPQAVSQLVNEIRGPGPESIQAIADAMMLDPSYVMRVAGLLPPEEKKPSTVAQEIIRLVEHIPAPEQQDLLDIVRAYTRRYQRSRQTRPE